MCSAIGVIGEGVLTNRIRLCILDMSVFVVCDGWSLDLFACFCFFEVLHLVINYMNCIC